MPTSDSLSASWQAPPVEALASTHKKRILVVDDHALVRAGFRQLIDRTDDLEVGGEAGTAAGAVSFTPPGGDVGAVVGATSATLWRSARI